MLMPESSRLLPTPIWSNRAMSGLVGAAGAVAGAAAGGVSWRYSGRGAWSWAGDASARTKPAQASAAHAATLAQPVRSNIGRLLPGNAGRVKELLHSEGPLRL